MSNTKQEKKENKLTNIIISIAFIAIFIIMLFVWSDMTKNIENENDRDTSTLKENRKVLNIKEIEKFANKMKEEQDLIIGRDDKFTYNRDALITTKYRDAAFYFKYLIDPVINSKNEPFNLSNVKFVYQNQITSLFAANEKDFNKYLDDYGKDLTSDDFKGKSLSDEKLVQTLNKLIDEEVSLLKEIYATYKINEKGSIVLKEGKEPISTKKLKNLNTNFYEENELSNHYVQYSIAFELFNNSLTLHGEATNDYLQHLLIFLNTQAYYDFSVLDENISNIAFDKENKDYVLNTEQRDYLLNLIAKVRVSLEKVNETNFYGQQVKQTLNRFEKLVKDETTTQEELSSWYIVNPNDILMFSKDSVRNSFFMINEK